MTQNRHEVLLTGPRASRVGARAPVRGIRRLSTWLRLETLLLLCGLTLCVLGALAYRSMQATVLRVAVAPRDGTEPGLFRAFAEALQRRDAKVRLKLLSYDDVDGSARALTSGAADLAVVRPDVAMPPNGLSIAVLRDQAVLIASPPDRHIGRFSALAGRRLGIVAHAAADANLLRDVAMFYGLRLDWDDGGPAAADQVLLKPLRQADLATALRSRRIDAAVLVVAPTAPRARAFVDSVRSVSRTHRVTLVGFDEVDALTERFPSLQEVDIPTSLFGGRPATPADDLKTIGASYRLMARSSLPRDTAAALTQQLFELRPDYGRASAAAAYVKAPDYETTVGATSSVLPIHPGAIDYYEREQRGFFDKYGDLMYLVAFLLGGVGSALAWLQQRLSRRKRELADEVIDRLDAIAEAADRARTQAERDEVRATLDRFALDAARELRRDDASQVDATALDMAISATRSRLEREGRAPLGS